MNRVRPQIIALMLVGFCATSSESRGAIYSEGHADLSVRMVGNQLQLGVNLLGAVVDGVVTNEFAPLTDLTLFVPETALEQRTENIPGLLNFDPIGVVAGTDIYRLPASGTEALILQTPYFGFGTYLLNAADFASPVKFTLTGFSSSEGGEFSVYQDSFPGPTFYMSTANGVNVNDSLTMPVGAHDHFNFVFTKPGLYELSFTATVTHKTLGVLTASGSLSSGVVTTVPEASSFIFGALAIGTLLLGRTALSLRRTE